MDKSTYKSVGVVALIVASLFVGAFLKPKVEQINLGGGGYRENTKEIAILTSATTTATGEVASVVYYRNLGITVATEGSTGTLKFACSLQDAAADGSSPDFSTAQSATNTWDYAQIVDTENGLSIDGDTGLTLADTTDVRLFEVDSNNFRWCTALLSGTVSGTTTVKFKPADNQ